MHRVIRYGRRLRNRVNSYINASTTAEMKVNRKDQVMVSVMAMIMLPCLLLLAIWHGGFSGFLVLILSIAVLAATGYAMNWIVCNVL